MGRLLILGCGWVGESFAMYAMAQGLEVSATTTTQDKAQRLTDLGIHAYVHDFDSSAFLPDGAPAFDYILNSIPASKKLTAEITARRFTHVAATLRQVPYLRHIYLSSIGVYPDLTATYEEDFADQTSLHPILRNAEIIVSVLPNTYIYRLGGLFGKNRIFAKYFAGKVCTSGDQCANFVHLDDVVQLIWIGFTSGLNEPLYNVVCPEHPRKEAVVRASAHRHRYELPTSFESSSDKSFQKIVSGKRLQQELTYRFIYKSPLLF